MHVIVKSNKFNLSKTNISTKFNINMNLISLLPPEGNCSANTVIKSKVKKSDLAFTFIH